MYIYRGLKMIMQQSSHLIKTACLETLLHHPRCCYSTADQPITCMQCLLGFFLFFFLSFHGVKKNFPFNTKGFLAHSAIICCVLWCLYRRMDEITSILLLQPRSLHCLRLVPAVYTSCVSMHRLQTDSKDVQETCVKLFINFEVYMLHGSGINNMQQSKNTKSTLIAQQGSLLADFTQSLISRIMSRIEIFLIKDQAGQFNYQLFLP